MLHTLKPSPRRSTVFCSSVWPSLQELCCHHVSLGDDHGRRRRSSSLLFPVSLRPHPPGLFLPESRTIKVGALPLVAFFQLPQSTVARRVAIVKVLIRVLRVEPESAQIAVSPRQFTRYTLCHDDAPEMSLTLGAVHVIASHLLRRRGEARRTRRRVETNVLVARLFLFAQLARVARVAAGKITVPAGQADAAKGEGAFAADGESI